MTNGSDSPLDAVARHRECWERIAWLANETLDPDERPHIEAHLQACSECQEELALQRRMRELMRAEEAVVLAPQTALQKLMQRVDAEEAGVDLEAPPLKRAASPVRSNARWPRWLAVAAALQAVAIALLLATQWRSPEHASKAPRFATLTEGTPATATGPAIRVVFAADASLTDVNALLRSVDAQIIAGPTEAGVYTLAPAPAAAETGGAFHVDHALIRLRADARVLFAEAAVTRVPP